MGIWVLAQQGVERSDGGSFEEAARNLVGEQRAVSKAVCVFERAHRPIAHCLRPEQEQKLTVFNVPCTAGATSCLTLRLWHPMGKVQRR